MKFVLVTHLELDAVTANAERLRGIELELRAMGHSVERVLLRPDPRLRNRRLRRDWYFRPAREWERDLVRRASGADALIVSALPIAYAARHALAELAGRTRIVYDAENDETRLAAQIGGWPYTHGVPQREADVLKVADVVWMPGSRDAATLRGRHPSLHVVDLPTAAADDLPLVEVEPRPGHAFVYGAWGYRPNRWGLLQAVRTPSAVRGTFSVFGRVPRKLARQIARAARAGSPHLEWRVRGFAPDLAGMVEQAAGPLLLPLWLGGGAKIRTAQMAAMGVPVRGTSEAVAGLPEWLREGLGSEDDPQLLLEWAASTGRADWVAARELALRVREEFTWRALLPGALAESGLA